MLLSLVILNISAADYICIGRLIKSSSLISFSHYTFSAAYFSFDALSWWLFICAHCCSFFHMNRANVLRPQCIHIIIFGSFLFLHRIFANLNRCVFYTYINWVQLFILDAFSAKLFFLVKNDFQTVILLLFFAIGQCSQFISKCLRCSILNPVPLFVFLHFYRLHESSANFLRPFSNSTLLKRQNHKLIEWKRILCECELPQKMHSLDGNKSKG